jgi:protocatechuate 3,4-dioxygenase alpha subunit
MERMERMQSVRRADSQDTRLVASASQTVGPFFHVGPGGTDRFGRMAGPDTPGERIRLRVRVLDGDGLPVNDALIELLQPDAGGTYSAPPSAPSAPAAPSTPTAPSAPAAPAAPASFTGFGRLGTDADGWCTFETIRPGRAPDGPRAAEAPHLEVCLFARGLLRHLYTRIYFDDDPANASDPLMSLVPEDRRDTLVAHRSGDPATWEFVVRLQGVGETVFFDV